MKRTALAIWVSLIGVLAAACGTVTVNPPSPDAGAGPAPGPVVPAPDPPRPDAGQSGAGPAGEPLRPPADPACRRTLQDRWARSPLPRWDIYGDTTSIVNPASGCTVVVGTEPVSVTVWLPPGTREDDARRGLEVSGLTPERIGWDPGELPILLIRFGSGPPGQSWEVILRDAPAPEAGRTDLRVRLVREEEPAVQVSVGRDGLFREPRPLEVIPPPVDVKLAFSRNMDRESVEAALRRPDGRGRFRWLDGRTLLWTPPAGLHRIALDLYRDRVRDTAGLTMKPGAPTVFWVGEPPRLVAARPEGDLVLGALPPDIVRAFPDPSGTRLALSLAPEGPGPFDVLVQPGEETRSPLPDRAIGWTPSGRLVLAGKGVLRLFDPGRGTVREMPAPALESPVLSPDGRRVATLRTGRQPVGQFLHPVDVVVYDLETGGQQVFPRAFTRYLPPTDGDMSIHPAWSPDGQTLSVIDVLGRDADGLRLELITLDVATGERRAAEAAAPAVPWGRSPAWSPSGRYLALGPHVYDRQQGRWLETGLDGPALWHPTEDRLLGNRREWDEVLVYDPASGTAVSRGHGLPVGWTPDGFPLVIRWPDSDQRWRPECC